MKKNHRSKQLSLCAVIPYLCKVSTCMGPPRKDELLKRCVLLRRGRVTCTDCSGQHSKQRF